GAGVGPRAVKRLGHLPDVTQASPIQLLKELGGLAIVLVKRQPVQGDAVHPGAVDLLQGDPPLGAMDHLVGDATSPAARTVLIPGLGQEEVGIDQGLVAAAGDPEVDGDDAVLLLADLTTVLALHAGGVAALLD